MAAFLARRRNAFTHFARILRTQSEGAARSLNTNPCKACAEELALAGKQQGWNASAVSFAVAGVAALSTMASTNTTALCAPTTLPAPYGKAAGSGVVGEKKHPMVVFVLGGPGAGKGTQCANLVRDYGYTHLSAGDLLREHIKSGSKEGNMVADMIKNGQIVPSEVTVGLLADAMLAAKNDKFLIDGFPRNAENRAAFEHEMGYDCEFVLFFDCPEAVMEKRLLGRNEGRTDDNIETIRKRFKVFVESSMPVVSHYESQGKVKRVIADKSMDEVYELTRSFFNPYVKDEVLSATSKLLGAIDANDWDTYQSLLSPGMTAFEPEACGHCVEGLDFHRFYFALGEAQQSTFKQSVCTKSHMLSPKVNLLVGGKSAVVTYIRLIQQPGDIVYNPSNAKQPSSSRKDTPQQHTGWWNPAPSVQALDSRNKDEEIVPTSCIRTAPSTVSYQETRVWEQKSNGKWLCVHFHRSHA